MPKRKVTFNDSEEVVEYEPDLSTTPIGISVHDYCLKRSYTRTHIHSEKRRHKFEGEDSDDETSIGEDGRAKPTRLQRREFGDEDEDDGDDVDETSKQTKKGLSSEVLDAQERLSKVRMSLCPVTIYTIVTHSILCRTQMTLGTK